jgi:RNA polymerase sigma factor (sigma-70 family)
MNCDRSGPVLRQLGVLFGSGTVAGMTDGQLLERFATSRGPESESAFAALVARHGPMVLRVCRQFLGDTHDADDAFQAAFLTLAGKAGALRQPDRLGPWLYGVAVRKSRKLKQQRARRWKHERRSAAAAVGGGEEPQAKSREELREESAALHEELARLPEKYRAPIVLCYLEGHTHETAAAALGWPLGTVRGRLARARDQLRARMTARGAVPSGLVIGRWPGDALPTAHVPAALSEAAVRGASRTLGGSGRLLAWLTGLKAAWPKALGAPAPRIAAALALAGAVAVSAAGFASWRRTAVAGVRAPASAVPRPEANRGPTEADAGLARDQLPHWVIDAVRGLQPEATIARAIRESDMAYLVEIRRGDAQPPVTARVTGRFAPGRRLTVLRRVREGSLAGRGA